MPQLTTATYAFRAGQGIPDLGTRNPVAYNRYLLGPRCGYVAGLALLYSVFNLLSQAKSH